MDLKSFEKQVAVSTEDICREIFRNRSGSIKVKKEKVAVRNLVRIFKATLKLANNKGFHAMSLRDLCAESGMSMGGLYAYFKNKEELLTLIQEQGRAIVARVMMDQLAGIDEARRALDRAIRSHLYLSEVLQPWFFFLVHGNPVFFTPPKGSAPLPVNCRPNPFFPTFWKVGSPAVFLPSTTRCW
jgi:hypothetical protein